MPSTRSSPVVDAPGFDSYWTAETLRLREALWGPLEDTAEARRVRAHGGSFVQKLLLRAQLLARREHLDTILRQWRQGSRLVLIAMCLASLVAGGAAAAGALGDGGRPVNILLALVAMLGLNTLALVFWLLSFFTDGAGTGSWLGDAWLLLTRKLAKGPDAALAPRAWIEILARHRALRWMLGGVSHGIWAVALLGVLAGLFALLSARRYTFNWETTLLSPDTFVSLTAALGWLPSQLGFAVPPDAIVRASDGLRALPEAAQSLWSGWLLGCIVAYGLLPRLLLLVASAWLVRKRLSAIALDESLPGYAELRDRLAPASKKTGIDGPGEPAFQARLRPRAGLAYRVEQPVLLGIELASDTPWPPLGLPTDAVDLGVIDTRAQRTALLDHLQLEPPRQLLLACDGRQTPDRGTVALVADLASLAGTVHVTLVGLQAEPAAHDARAAAWREQLLAAGFDDDQLHMDLASALAWLASSTQRSPGVKDDHDRP
ncbi:MAG TPA: DUF2868 domain-containing protein [Candidimonas sp.]|nr:DUF2868 domain-containing protein [Candidimonas sp.]